MIVKAGFECLGDIIGPAGTYQSLNTGPKWVLLLAMIVGRLEIVTALVVGVRTGHGVRHVVRKDVVGGFGVAAIGC